MFFFSRLCISGHMGERGYVYVMASERNGTLYIGVTSDLIKRVWEHKEGCVDGFTKKYGCKLLVWFQAFDDITTAIQHEKAMKKWNRSWKLRHIEGLNPDWRDLWDEIAS